MNPLLVLPAAALASFASSYMFLPWLIRNLKGTPAVGKDLNKPGGPVIPEMGGLGVILGFYVGVGLLTALSPAETSSSIYYAALASCLGAGAVGLIDDMFNLTKGTKAFLPFLLSIPLGTAAMASGDTILLGVNIGIWIVPLIALGLTSAANAANMLEGFNGLGAGLGIIMSLGMIGLVGVTGETPSLYLVLPLLGALLAFFLFNSYPARIFPGDSMTLFVGATIAAAAILSHLKTFGALLFIPMAMEFSLKARGKFRAENYGTVGADGTLSYSGKIESLSHALMRWRRLTEQQIVRTLWAIQALVAIGTVLAAAVWL